MRLKLLAIVGLLVVAGGAVVASMGGLAPAATASTTLLTATASIADVTDEIAATGTVEAVSQAVLRFGAAASILAGDADPASASPGESSNVTWPVKALNVAVGDTVKQGDVLATADDADLEAQIADATRSAKSAALQLKIAQENRADADTTDAKRQTQLALYGAQSADARAKADLAALIALRDHTTLIAPIDGTVTNVAISTGADAPTGAAITILSADRQVVTSVVESDVGSIKTGQSATVDVAAIDASLVGTVTGIDPVGSGSGQNGVVAFAVEVSLDAPPAGLRPGMSADITIVAASAQDVLSIPSRALSGSGGNYTVRVVAADGTVSTKPVQVGLVTSSLAEITSGLQAGDVVVTGTSSDQNGTTNFGGNGGPGFIPGGGGTVIRGQP